MSVTVSVIVVPLTATAVTAFVFPVLVLVTVKSSISSVRTDELATSTASDVVKVIVFVPAFATAPDVAASLVDTFTVGRIPSTTISAGSFRAFPLPTVGSVRSSARAVFKLSTIVPAVPRGDVSCVAKSVVVWPGATV